MKFKPRMFRSMSPHSIVCFICFFLCVCEPTRFLKLALPRSWYVFSFLYFRRSAWIYCVTSFGVPSPLSRNRYLTLYFLLWSIQYWRQMIILCYRYRHGSRGQNISHHYCIIMPLVPAPELSLYRGWILIMIIINLIQWGWHFTAQLTNLWPLFPDWIEICSVGFCGGRKTGEPGEKPLEQGQEPTTNSTHMWRRVRESNPGHRVGGERSHHCTIRASPNIPNPYIGVSYSFKELQKWYFCDV